MKKSSDVPGVNNLKSIHSGEYAQFLILIDPNTSIFLS